MGGSQSCLILTCHHHSHALNGRGDLYFRSDGYSWKYTLIPMDRNLRVKVRAEGLSTECKSGKEWEDNADTLETFCDSGPRGTSALSSCSAILHVAACCHKMEVEHEVGARFSLATCGSQAAAQPGKIVRSDRPQASFSIKQPSTSHPAGKRMRDVFC